jgi:hypothetical protein
MLTALVARRALPEVGVADFGRRQRIGRGDSGGPARANRRQNLHRQRDQDDRKKFL